VIIMQIHTISIPESASAKVRGRKYSRQRDDDLFEELNRVKTAETIAYQQRSRFAMRSYLKQVYRLYDRWKRTGEANQSACRAAALQGVTVRRGTHPLKILIDLTTPPNHADAKVRSRMARALEFAAVEKIRPSDLADFLNQSSRCSMIFPTPTIRTRNTTLDRSMRRAKPFFLRSIISIRP
jgi:hypothetical protein